MYLDKLNLILGAQGWTEVEMKKLNEEDFLAQVLLVVRGQAVITNTNDKKETAPEIPTAEGIDPIIRVDRSIRPIYPERVKKVMHPELENIGPAEFDINQIEQWLHPNQTRGTVRGGVIYKYLKDNDMLKTCLGLSDLLAIQKKGIAFFRKYFAGKAVFGWKSVVLRHDGSLRVPCFVEVGGGVFVCWRWLGRDWYSNDPALRLASLPAEVSTQAG